ncbi:piggyBac transposable element-derived protein 4-like [Penaeus japonicus]|uniref:piggyBac transposable element-derived protein 4-like n=1 Tax=Penaeus japonicus TaxID=27405 RepID=UPI001C70B177|nr:piggyBac transposable element-derived protein 4-like [Penaeus japonicus]
MESSSDEYYVPDFEDEDSDDLSEEFEDKDEFSENESREIEGGWRLISDIFSDMREDPLPEYLGDHCGWKKVLEKDMYSFLVLVIAMGLVKVPRMSQYWRSDWVVCGPPVYYVKKNEPRARIEPFLSLLREKCKVVISPGKHMATNEALVLWKGRLGFCQYIKSKRARFGIKVFVLCPSDPNWQGYS